MTASITGPSPRPDIATRRGEPASGMPALIESIAADIEPGERLQSVATRILTFGGRQSIDEGRKCLTAWQREVLALAGSAPVDANPRDAVVLWWIGMYEFGRIYLAAETPPPHVRLFGCVEADVAAVAACAFSAAEFRLAEAAREREIERWLDALDEHEASRVVYAVREAIDHVDPVLIYVRETTFTNFSTHNNLLSSQSRDPGRYVLDAAATTPPGAWSAPLRTFIACFWWMLEAGARGEEANGRQLTPATLSLFLDERMEALTAANGASAQEEFTERSIAEKATMVREYARRASETHLVYRSINGLTFAKDVHWTLEREPIDIPPRLALWMRERLTLDPGDFRSTDELFAAAADALIDTEGGPESLMEALVAAAVVELRSDIGMTRGIRDLAAWQRTLDAGDAETACKWDTAAYYCGVFPSPGVLAHFTNDGATLLRILNSIARRMEYNSWHYLPGHFDRESVPSSRHFFYPPRLPDLARWGDMHHPGHVRARVRFSIRAPEPLVHSARRYDGMVDLRLLRMSGEPYTVGEMILARAFSRCVRALSQALADCAARGRSYIVAGFRSAWYERRFGIGGESR